VWAKSRNVVDPHVLTDSVRGVQKTLMSNDTAAEYADSTGLTAFGSDGFTIGTASRWNGNTRTYVAWNWKANGAGVSNTAGYINSTVSANTDAKFSVVSYTGVGGEPKTVAHGLGVSPEMVVIKKRNNVANWVVWHKDLADKYAFEGLNTTGAAINGGSPISKYVDAVSSTLVTLGDAGENNASGDTYIMYCWASVEGYSKVGSYTGNGSSDGTFVHCGFRPAYVMLKNATLAGEHWVIFDSTRDIDNVLTHRIYANDSAGEGVSGTALDLVSNGFKMREGVRDYNGSGDTFIFLAFAEVDFKHSNAR
jgi:hypothetical protein